MSAPTPAPRQEAAPYTREELEALPKVCGELMQAIIERALKVRESRGTGMDAFDYYQNAKAEYKQVFDHLLATARQGVEDTARLDWLEATKRERGRGGWRIDPPSDGWPLQVFTRGPYHSIRAAIDAARTTGVTQ